MKEKTIRNYLLSLSSMMTRCSRRGRTDQCRRLRRQMLNVMADQSWFAWAFIENGIVFAYDLDIESLNLPLFACGLA